MQLLEISKIWRKLKIDMSTTDIQKMLGEPYQLEVGAVANS